MSPVVASAAPETPPVSAPDLTDDVRLVPDIDVDADAAADAAQRSTMRHAAPDVHLVYASVVDVVSGTTPNELSADQLSQSNVAVAIKALNDYWFAESGGAVSFVLAGYETRSYSADTCDSNTVADDQAAEAFGGFFAKYGWVGSNKHLLTLTKERDACGNQGFGTVGGRGGEIFDANGVSGTYGVPVLLHEFGHNLGFGHADVSICTNGRLDGVVADFAYAGSACPTLPYGDYLDIMGFTVGGVTPHLSAIEKIRFGWFAGSYADVTNPGTTVVSSLNGTTGVRALQIRDPLSGELYVVEYRTAEGIDAASNEFTLGAKISEVGKGHRLYLYGANAAVGSVRVMREIPFNGPQDVGFGSERTYTETTVMATTPVAGQSAWRTPRVDVGMTFTSASGGIVVRVDSADPAIGAAVTVAFPYHSPTITTLSASRSGKQTYGAKAASRVVLTARVTAADGTPVPVGTASLFDGSTKVTSAAVVGGSATFRLDPATASGRHAFSVRYTVNDSYLASTSAISTVKIAKAKATTTLRFSKSKVTTRTKAKATITVAVKGEPNPTGKLDVYVGGKKVKSYPLSARKKGVVTVTLPKISTIGTKKIYVKYRGNTNIAADNSVKKRLRVTY